ncbi:MAG: hypothetical protein ACKV2T_07975 [Kofleriaceae bacterium]
MRYALVIVLCGCSTAAGLSEPCESTKDCDTSQGLFCARAGGSKRTCVRSCAIDKLVFSDDVRVAEEWRDVDRYLERIGDAAQKDIGVEPRTKVEHVDSCTLQYGEKAACHAEGYCFIDRDPCKGRCSPNTMKCVDGTCVLK